MQKAKREAGKVLSTTFSLSRVVVVVVVVHVKSLLRLLN
jgi:hypothetical protein